MSRFKWYRKLRGGYWVFEIFSEWYQINKDSYDMFKCERCGMDYDYLEDWT